MSEPRAATHVTRVPHPRPRAHDPPTPNPTAAPKVRAEPPPPEDPTSRPKKKEVKPSGGPEPLVNALGHEMLSLGFDSRNNPILVEAQRHPTPLDPPLVYEAFIAAQLPDGHHPWWSPPAPDGTGSTVLSEYDGGKHGDFLDELTFLESLEAVARIAIARWGHAAGLDKQYAMDPPKEDRKACLREAALQRDAVRKAILKALDDKTDDGDSDAAKKGASSPGGGDKFSAAGACTGTTRTAPPALAVLRPPHGPRTHALTRARAPPPPSLLSSPSAQLRRRPPRSASGASWATSPSPPASHRATDRGCSRASQRRRRRRARRERATALRPSQRTQRTRAGAVSWTAASTVSGPDEAPGGAASRRLHQRREGGGRGAPGGAPAEEVQRR